MMNACRITKSWTNGGKKEIGNVVQYFDNSGSITAPEEQFDNAENLVTLVPPDEDTPCTVELECSQPHLFTINGLLIVSEARYIEVSTSSDGHLGTGRGILLDGTKKKFYAAPFQVNAPLKNCLIKFVSFADKTAFQIYRINVIIQPADGVQGQGRFDIDKVQQLMEDMGKEIPTEARGLLTAMERSGTQPPGAAPDMSQMMAMFSMMTMQKPPTGPPVTAPGAQSSNPNDMYGFLQNICSSVTKARVDDAKPPAAEGAKAVTPEEEVEKKLEEMEGRIMQTVDSRLDNFESKISGKMDLLLDAVLAQKKE